MIIILGSARKKEQNLSTK